MPSSRGRGVLWSFIRSLSQSLELPQEIVLDVPKVTLIGGVQAHIENHKGVLEYTPCRIRVRTRAGRLTVEGEGLSIGSIYKDELVVDGRIARIDLDAAGGRGEAPER